MASPFPGMNPYLEQEDVWHDFHERFIPAAAGTIDSQVGTDYIVKIDEHVYIHELPDGRDHLLGRADSFVARQPRAEPDRSAAGVLAAPAMVTLPMVDRESQSIIEIRDRRNREVVTVIEVLSPSNKSVGPDREQYLGKRGQLLASHASFVEIDLLRAGPRMPMMDLPDCDYCVMVSRVQHRPRADLWPIHIRERLPVIPIPLRPGEPEPQLDLQATLNRVYDEAGYHKYIYDDSANPPLSDNDRQWATSVVRSP